MTIGGTSSCADRSRLLAAAILLALTATPAFAQASGESGPATGDPDPTTGELDIQAPGPRVAAAATLSSGDEYRDRLLGRQPTGSVAVGIAYEGFAISSSGNWEVGARRAYFSSETLLDYSYKLPLVDAHLGYVICSNKRLAHGCPDAFRLSLTTNSIRGLTAELSVDQPPNSSRHTLAGSVIGDVWKWGGNTVSLRAAFATTNYGSAGHLSGWSVRALASHRVSNRLSLEGYAGYIETRGRVRPTSARSAVIGGISVVRHL